VPVFSSAARGQAAWCSLVQKSLQPPRVGLLGARHPSACAALTRWPARSSLGWRGSLFEWPVARGSLQSARCWLCLEGRWRPPCRPATRPATSTTGTHLCISVATPRQALLVAAGQAALGFGYAGLEALVADRLRATRQGVSRDAACAAIEALAAARAVNSNYLIEFLQELDRHLLLDGLHDLPLVRLPAASMAVAVHLAWVSVLGPLRLARTQRGVRLQTEVHRPAVPPVLLASCDVPSPICLVLSSRCGVWAPAARSASATIAMALQPGLCCSFTSTILSVRRGYC
jgi:hypothetical protein